MNTEIDMNKVSILCDKMLNKYGKEKQIIQLIQELAELIQVLTKLSQYGETNERIYGKNGILNEASDVWLMLQQLETIFDDKEMWLLNKNFVIHNAFERLNI